MKEIYITDSEREKCRKVADAFAELYEVENILVVDAGRYGFVKLQYYRPPQGFEDAITFTDSWSILKNRPRCRAGCYPVADPVAGLTPEIPFIYKGFKSSDNESNGEIKEKSKNRIRAR